MEIFLKNKKLIEENDWTSLIDEMKSEVRDSDEKRVKELVVNAVDRRIPKNHFGVLFSGGVDSSLIALLCRKKTKKFTCYCVGFKTEAMDMPPDIDYAQKVAEAIDVELKFKVFNLDEAEKIIRKAVAILAKPEKVDADYVVKVGVASVVIAVAGIAEDKLFFSGLGSEELFAGYERHEKAGDVNEECWRGLRAMWRRDLIRDSAVAEALDIELRTPFLDKGLIVSAMAVPGNRKINDKDKKIILREIAEELGLEEYAWRKKQGAQYGSRFDRAIAKLAKKKGFEKKGDYLRGLLNEI